MLAVIKSGREPRLTGQLGAGAATLSRSTSADELTLQHTDDSHDFATLTSHYRLTQYV